MTVYAHDPAVDTGTKGLDDIEIASDALAACDGADVLVVLTEWGAFRNIDLAAVAERMTGRTIIDARNILDPAAARAAGFDYQGIGRRVPS